MRSRGLRSIGVGAAVVVCGAGFVLSPVPARAGGVPVAPPPPAVPAPVGTAPVHPNILMILTDDMSRADLHSMPSVRRLITRQGMRFTRAMVSVSLCCPSRTTILRGQYAHNTGVKTNGGSNGGFETAYRDKVEQSTLATWLHRVGYRTGLIGKYLNGYPNGAPANYRPPGWTDWVTPVKGTPYNEYGYRLEVDGHTENHYHRPQDYGTRVYLRHARRFISESTRLHQPFFLDLALYAPHRPATPDPRDLGTLHKVRLPRPRSFDERDVQDKPSWLRQVPRLGPDVIRREHALFEKRRESLRSVDRAVTNLIGLLDTTHVLDDTYVMFTSDNGFHIGEHRLPAGKQTAFEEDIRIPMVMRGPGIPAGSTDRSLVGNVDIAPTFAALAGAPTPRFVDGRSLVGSLHADPPTGPPRRAFLLEHWRERGQVMRDPELPLEPPDNDQTEGATHTRSHPPDTHRPHRGRRRPPGHRHRGLVDQDKVPDYEGLRTDFYTYVEYRTGEHELYDLRSDPAELHNAWTRATFGTQAALHRELLVLQSCRGAKCRAGESRPPVRLRWRPKVPAADRAQAGG